MYNKVILIGNLTRDVELKYLTSGTAIGTSSIATSHKYKTVNGEQKEEVCFLEFTLFGKVAQTANQYLRKGSKLMLEGRLVFEQWQDQNGQKRSKHTLRVETMKMLGEKNNTMQPNQAPQSNSNQQHGHNQPNQAMQNNQQYQQYIQKADDLLNYENDEIPF